MVFMWLQQLIIGHAIKYGLDKSLKFIFMGNPLTMSISISIEKTQSELKIEAADYLLRAAFGKNKKLVNLIKANYKTNPELVISELSKSLLSCGADFGNETDSKIKEIGIKFINCFSYELPMREKVPISSSQTSDATLNGVNEILAILKQDDALESVGAKMKKSSPSDIPVVVAKDSDAELANSKYKKDIDDAKVLLDKEKYVGAKIIYEKLLKDFESDSNVPVMARFKVHNNLGACQTALGQRSEAANNFRVAFDIVGSTSIIACKNRALASLFEGKPMEGIPFIDAAIALSPDNNECFNLKAMLLRGAGRFDEAIEIYSDKGEK